MKRALLVVAPLDVDGAPAAPEQWGRTVHGRTGWTSLRLPGGGELLAFKENERNARGLFAIFGEDADLANLASRVDAAEPARKLWRLGDTLLRGWRTWRFDGIERDPITGDPVAVTGARRELVPMGAVLPGFGTLPWNLDAAGQQVAAADAVVRVTALRRPALAHAVAGRPSAQEFEDEPDDEAG